MTGSALWVMDVMLMVAKRFLEESEERRYMSGSRLARPGGLLQIYIYIYIHTKTQLFRISILDLFWRGFGEVLKRDFGEEKLQKPYVLYWCLIATI